MKNTVILVFAVASATVALGATMARAQNVTPLAAELAASASTSAASLDEAQPLSCPGGPYCGDGSYRCGSCNSQWTCCSNDTRCCRRPNTDSYYCAYSCD